MREISSDQLKQLAVQYMDSCQECSGRRVLENGQCGCVRRYEIAIAQWKANIPENFKHMSIKETVEDDFKKHNAKSAGLIFYYLDKLKEALRDGGSLYLYGPGGAGVSFLGVSILKRAIEDNFSAYFMLSGDLWRSTKETLTDSSEYLKMVNIMTTADFLLIDDIDQMFISRTDSTLVAQLHGFLKMRFYANKPIIFTSSMKRDDLEPPLPRFVSIYAAKIVEIELDANHISKLQDSWKRTFFNGR